MPLAKRSTAVTPTMAGTSATATLPPPAAADAPTKGQRPAATENAESAKQQTLPAKRIGGTRGAKPEAPLSKKGYWDRKEARDIETGIRIRRSGVWQAALQSMGVLQLNTANTLESFLALVEKAADAGLEYVNRD